MLMDIFMYVSPINFEDELEGEEVVELPEEDPHRGMVYNPVSETWGWGF